MPNFAIIKNNIVDNVIICDSKEIALDITKADDAIETEGQPWIGWIFVNDQWIDPLIQVEPLPENNTLVE